jgi:hypothetical protein
MVGELAQAGHRHLQRARDRRGRQREHMHVGAKLLERLLVGDAETLFFVDDHQAQTPERRALAQNRVRADHDIHRPVGERVAGRLRFRRRHKSREAPDPQRKSGEALAKALVVLAREQRGRCDHRNLLSAHRRDERGAQRDLCLAEADVAADQAIHRLALGEVAEHVRDRLFLVVGFLPREALDELVEGALLGFEHRRTAQRAGGGGAQQLVGDLADAFLEPRLAPLPAFAAELVEHCARPRRCHSG